MSEVSTTRINRLLADWGQGDEQAREALIPLVYNELRRQARRHLRAERVDHTLESAALVNEAYLAWFARIRRCGRTGPTFSEWLRS